MDWINVKDRTPVAQSINDENNEYYFVRVNLYGIHQAMYLIDGKGQCGWYTSYFEKIFREVSEWKARV
jgi:hypothetical protein